jgi:hypothetical protein
MVEKAVKLSFEEFAELISILLRDGSIIAIDKQYESQKIDIIEENKIKNQISSYRQFFMKNRKYSNCIFITKEVNNVHVGKIYPIIETLGDGSITLYYDHFGICYISYKDFYELDGNFIKPSEYLVNYFNFTLKTARSISKKIK